MDQTIRLSVILCTWNRAASLATTLSSIDALELPPDIAWEVLIVDNNSSDDTKTVCQQFLALNPQRYRYVFEKRQGKSFALNTGIENARGEILVFTDDDVTVDKRWLAETAKIYETFPCIGVGGKIVDAWSSRKPDWLSLEGPYKLRVVIVTFDLGEEPCALKTAPYGANMSMRKEAFQKYGNFRADLGPTGGKEFRGEDTEFCRRLLRAGETLIYAPKAIVFHPVAEHRMTKRYFAEWYYAFGQSTARIERPPEHTARYFGFPRYMVRACIQDILLWMTSISAQRRFFYKLQFLCSWGQMTEERRLWHNGKKETRRKTPVDVS